MLSMIIVHIWADFGRIICAKSVQARWRVQKVCKLKVWLEFVQNVCKDFGRRAVFPPSPAIQTRQRAARAAGKGKESLFRRSGARQSCTPDSHYAQIFHWESV